jgi:type II secretory pathway component PulL
MQNSRRRVILAFAALIIAFSMANGYTHALTQEKATPNQAAQEDAHASDTFRFLLLADQSGANVTTQVSQFNLALELIANGTNLINSGNYQQGQLKLSEADQILVTVSHDAVTLRTEAQARNRRHVLETYGFAIGFIIVTTILAFLTVRWHDRYMRRRMLDLQFEVKSK